MNTLNLPPTPAALDISGYHVFADGPEGAAHRLSHRLLDTGDLERGYQSLDRFLAARSGSGPRWVHLNWHLAVLAVGTHRCDRALGLLEEAVLPGVDAGDGLVDGPQLLVRLALSDCSQASSLPWERVAEAARTHLGSSSAYTELHNLLALAGGRDIASLDRWLSHGGRSLDSAQASIVENFGRGLRAFLVGDSEGARALLSRSARAVARLGGSHAQNRIFSSLADAVVAGAWS